MSRSLTIILSALLLIPFSALAHETRQYEIDGVPYEIIVGSVGEPVVVDDKTGVALEVVRDGVYLVGAEELLEVELLAEGASRVQQFTPLYGTEGLYRSKYVATEAGPLTYRIFGELEGVPVDLHFPCNPQGHKHTQDNLDRKVISDKVVQILQTGMFSCPESKEALGFPHATEHIATLAATINKIPMQDTSPCVQMPLYVWLAVVSFLLGLILWREYVAK